MRGALPLFALALWIMGAAASSHPLQRLLPVLERIRRGEVSRAPVLALEEAEDRLEQTKGVEMGSQDDFNPHPGHTACQDEHNQVRVGVVVQRGAAGSANAGNTRALGCPACPHHGSPPGLEKGVHLPAVVLRDAPDRLSRGELAMLAAHEHLELRRIAMARDGEESGVR